MITQEEGMIQRIKELIEKSGFKKTRFAIEVGINSSNFVKKLEGKLGFSDNDIKLISTKTGVRKGWLLTGRGQMFNAPEEMKEQVRKDVADMEEKRQNDSILELYARCIRKLDDDHVEMRNHIDEIQKVRQQLADELNEVRQLKIMLREAIAAFNGNNAPLMAADEG